MQPNESNSKLPTKMETNNGSYKNDSKLDYPPQSHPKANQQCLFQSLEEHWPNL
jgi:hypothetical protein